MYSRHFSPLSKAKSWRLNGFGWRVRCWRCRESAKIFIVHNLPFFHPPPPQIESTSVNGQMTTADDCVGRLELTPKGERQIGTEGDSHTYRPWSRRREERKKEKSFIIGLSREMVIIINWTILIRSLFYSPFSNDIRRLNPDECVAVKLEFIVSFSLTRVRIYKLSRWYASWWPTAMLLLHHDPIKRKCVWRQLGRRTWNSCEGKRAEPSSLAWRRKVLLALQISDREQADFEKLNFNFPLSHIHTHKKVEKVFSRVFFLSRRVLYDLMLQRAINFPHLVRIIDVNFSCARVVWEWVKLFKLFYCRVNLGLGSWLSW